MKKSTLYTGGGDSGMTSLAGGVQVHKTHPRLETYGTIDELNAFIGLLINETESARIIELLQNVQHLLFNAGSYPATDTAQTQLKPQGLITAEDILLLEEMIDVIDDELPVQRGFVLPGGCRSAALAHVCRTVCRRAERALFRLNEAIPVDTYVLVFFNRLSDLLFVIARHECFYHHKEENIWNNSCK